MQSDIVKLLRAALRGEHEAISSRIGRLGLGFGGVSAEHELQGMFQEWMPADRQAEEIGQIRPSTRYHA